MGPVDGALASSWSGPLALAVALGMSLLLLRRLRRRASSCASKSTARGPSPASTRARLNKASARFGSAPTRHRHSKSQAGKGLIEHSSSQGPGLTLYGHAVVERECLVPQPRLGTRAQHPAIAPLTHAAPLPPHHVQHSQRTLSVPAPAPQPHSLPISFSSPSPRRPQPRREGHRGLLTCCMPWLPCRTCVWPCVALRP